MGLWSKIAGIGLGVAGAATGNPALIGMGASILTGGMAADASKDAAKTQSDSADKAMALGKQVYDQTSGIQKQVYDTTQAALAPYQALGAGSLGNLGGMVGLSPSSAAPVTSSSPMAIPQGGAALGAPMAGSTAPYQAPPQVTAELANQSGYTQGEKSGRREHLLRAPTGEMRLVPEDQVEGFIRRGAQKVGA